MLFSLFYFLNGLFILLLVGRLVMPGQIVLHIADTFTLHGVGDDDRGAVLLLFKFAESAENLGVVVTVDVDDVAIESLDFIGQRFQIHHFVGVAHTLNFIVVDDGAKVVQMVVGGKHERFPVGTLVHFAIAQQDESAIRAVLRSG